MNEEAAKKPLIEFIKSSNATCKSRIISFIENLDLSVLPANLNYQWLDIFDEEIYSLSDFWRDDYIVFMRQSAHPKDSSKYYYAIKVNPNLDSFSVIVIDEHDSVVFALDNPDKFISYLLA